MAWTSTICPSFLNDCSNVGRSDFRKATRAVSAIERDPFGKAKRILKRKHKNLYRVRVGNHRLIYFVGTNTIRLSAFKLRTEDLYDRLDLSSPTGEVEPVAVQIVPDDPVPTTFPESDSNDDVVDADISVEADDSHQAPLLPDLLEMWGIDDAADRKRIAACRSVDELFEIGLPQNTLEVLIDHQRPPTIQETLEERTLELPNLKALEDLREGPMTLEAFLLRLDPEQRRAVDRNTVGPILVRGGAGTGKSVVALHRIRNLFQPAARTLFDDEPPRVLFLTYTKALTNASSDLLRALIGSEVFQDHMTVKTVDAFARQLCQGQSCEAAEKSRQGLLTRTRRDVLAGSIDAGDVTRRVLDRLDDEYLLDEFEWIIDGNGVSTCEEYQALDRRGREVRLDQAMRASVWDIYEQWHKRMASVGPTYVQQQQVALEYARSLSPEKKFDVVVVDEAQDLKPVGLQLAFEMCRTPKGFYMTADPAQSIYGRGRGWRQVHDDLKLQGKTTVLRTNYRTTQELQAALPRFGDAEDVGVTAVRTGPKPIVMSCEGDQATVIARLFKAWADELRVPAWCGAVLVRDRLHGQSIARALRACGVDAMWTTSSDLDLRAPYVKVMTFHAAKGLEFPMVALAEVADGVVPWSRSTGSETEAAKEVLAQEQSLFYVALTRAMRRLVLCTPSANPSEFVVELDSDRWDWQVDHAT